MGTGIPITKDGDVVWVGVNDTETSLFEGLWPLPHGIAYNAYLIRAEKVVLVEAVKGLFTTELLMQLSSILGPKRSVDYLVINHVEPDHSGALRVLLDVCPDIQIVGNTKTIEFLRHLHGVSRNVRTMEDGDVLDLGTKTLRFLRTPMVHWPETMMTYGVEDRVLFSGDVFGGYGALTGSIFDDGAVDRGSYEEEALRYFANVIGKYSSMVQNALEKVRQLEVEVIAPSHGLVWRGDPWRVVDLYDRWSRHDPAPGVVIAYGSMYGNTAVMAGALARSLIEAGVTDLKMHDLSKTHPSYVLRDVWSARALVLGTPTYNLGIFPAVDHLVRLLEDKKPKNRLLAIFGTYGWSGGGVKGLEAFAARAGWELVEPVVEARFSPSEEALDRCARLAANLALRLRGELRES